MSAGAWMLKFRDVDFLDIGAMLTDGERLVRDSARRWVEERVIPIIEGCARDARFPRELIPEMAQLGFYGATMPDYGGAGLTQVEYGLIMQELERGDSGLRSFVSVHSALVMYPIHTFGSEEQKQRWLPAMQQGTALGCFGLTEPDFGSNPSGMRTRAVRKGDEFVLNGEKMWITSGNLAHVALIWAKDDEGAIRGFLVETDRPGFHATEIHGKYSLRASVTSSLALNDVHIPAANLLPGTRSLGSALSCLNQARYGIGWGAVGAAMQCYDTALQYAGFRAQFGKPIASHQIVQEKLVNMVSGLSEAQLLALHIGRLKDRGLAKPQHISLLKRNNVAMALDVARAARDLLGANGIADEYPVFRHMANLESVNTYEGTHDIHTLIVGHSITGIEAFS
ncbi:MAG: acyl-CoA dehydrogenase family protein [Terriglobales bacterium]